MSPRVSILIPTLDRAQYLQEAIDSALGQTFQDLEVLVFDNGTLDDTLAVVDKAIQRDGRLVFRRHPTDIGMSANFNALADAARGEFIVAIGNDDRLLPNFVERLFAEMRPEVNVVFSNHYLIDATGRRLHTATVAHAEHYGRKNLDAGILRAPEAAAWRQSIPMSASLVRKSDMQRLRFREDLNTPDTEFFIRLAQEGGIFAFVPEYLMEFRIHPKAVTVSGHWNEQLAECLTPLLVRPEVEPYKRELLTQILVNAVSRCLQQGKMELARKLLGNEYYPRGRQVTVFKGEKRSGGTTPRSQSGHNAISRQVLVTFLQSICATLPASIGAPIYRTIRRMRPAGLVRKHVY